jgi:hypothetical protein
MEYRNWLSKAALAILAAGFAWGQAGTTLAQAPGPVERDQTDPVVAPGVAGGSLLAWTEDLGNGHRIMAKRIFSNGLPIGGAQGGAWSLTGQVNPGNPPGDQRSPAFAEGLVFWSEKLDGGADYDIYAQRISGNGRTYGRPKLVVERPGNQSHPYVVQGASELLLVWSEDSDDAGDIWGLRISASALTPRGAAFEVAKGAGSATEPIIVPDPTERNAYLVMWTDDRAGNLDIYGTRVVPTGLPRGGSTGGQFAIVETPENDHSPSAIISSDRLNDSRPESSRSVLLWVHEDATDGPDVMAQRLRSNGYAFGGQIMVAGGPEAQLAPNVSLSEDEDWYVVWSAANAPAGMGGSLDIYQIDLRFNGHSRIPSRRLVAD